MRYGIVVAGGSGQRIGFKKQYLQLEGKPMWQRAVEALLSANVQKVWISFPREDIPLMRNYIQEQQLAEMCGVVMGGHSRFDSVGNALSEMKNEVEISSAHHVGIHDGARPFVRTVDVNRTYETAERTGAAVLADYCKDTIKQRVNDVVNHTLNRNEVVLAQTPQVFRMDWITDVYQRFNEQDWVVPPTDDSVLLEREGHSVQVIMSSGPNLKVTMASDIAYAEWYAKKLWGDFSENRNGF